MALNPLYVIAGSLDDYFVDKDTGLPLAGGTLQFFSDNNRSVPKDVFTISGVAPNYSYVNLGSVITLSATGNPTDGANNNIVIYYYPFDNMGNLDLYFVECFSAASVQQFTREGWPNTSAEVPNNQTANLVNYIPNGQFLAHNNIAANVITETTFGQVVGDFVEIAEGGWSFTRSSGSTAADYVQFFRFGNYVANPTASPRYSAQIQCNSPDVSDVFKIIQVKFDDVNKFSSDTQQYTFAFTASTVESANFPVSLFVVKNFGTGGSPSPPVSTLISVFTITSVNTIYQATFTFGNNSSYNIGTNNDDTVVLALNLPTNISFGLLATDFLLFSGSINVTNFPETTDRDFLARTMVVPVPDPNGYTLGLPIIQTMDGLGYDDSSVGSIVSMSIPTPPYGYLLCNGNNYRSDAYSSDGIPYRRLRNKLIQVPSGFNATNMPISGTGVNYVSANFSNAINNCLFITTNNLGPQSITVDGAVPTNFVFYNLKTGGTPSYGFKCNVLGTGNVLSIIGDTFGLVPYTEIGPGTSGFIVNTPPFSPEGGIVGNIVNNRTIVTINALPGAGTYFRVATPSVSYYVWFTINGAGADPAPGGTGIQVNLRSNMDKYDTAFTISETLNQHQVSFIQVIAGSLITSGSYFLFYANSTTYYVWYNLNGTGTDPDVPNSIGIPVFYTTAYTDTNIRTATVQSINDLFFATPNLQGIYLKGWDPFVVADQNSTLRYTNATRFEIPGQQNLPHYIGSIQLDYLQSHSHGLQIYQPIVPPPFQFNFATAGGPLVSDVVNFAILDAYGTAENDVKNMYVNFCIKY
jgi:hypothetical protein